MRLDGFLKVTKWSSILHVYYIDGSKRPFRLMNRLKGSHVPTKIMKIKVSCCIRLFRNTVASTLLHKSKAGSVSQCGQIKVVYEGVQATFILNFFGEWRRNSWRYLNILCRRMISVALVPRRTFGISHWMPSNKSKPPVLKHFIATIKDCIFLNSLIKMSVQALIQSRSTCKLFQQIRQHGMQNVNPIFTSYYRSLLVSNSRWHSPWSKC